MRLFSLVLGLILGWSIFVINVFVVIDIYIFSLVEQEQQYCELIE